MQTKPNFFLVGAEKCATTAMHAYLDAHPDIFMAVVKEPRHFDTDQEMKQDWCIRERDHYEALFANTERYPVVGEASPTYLSSAIAANNIAEFNPNARILIMLRHPVDYMYSLHRQYLSSSNEKVKEFSQALDLEPQRALGRNLPKGAHFPMGVLYRHRARFAEQVQRFIDAFGRSQVKVILLEDLKDDPLHVYREVLAYLDIDTGFSPQFDRYNVGESKHIRNTTLRRFLSQRKHMARLSQSVPSVVSKPIGSLLNLVLRESVDAKKPIDALLNQSLREEFRPEICRLGDLIGRDLSHWH